MAKRRTNSLLGIVQQDLLDDSLLAKARRAHRLHNELRQHFKEAHLTESHVIELSLLLTKRSPTEAEMAMAMIFYEYANVIRSIAQPGELENAAAHFLARDDTRAEVIVWWEAEQSIREDFRRRLKELKLAPTKASLRLKTEEDPLPSRVFILPVSVNANRYVWLEPSALCDLSLALIGKDREPDGLWNRLGECKRPDCSAFYLRKPRKGTKGGPPQKYCNPECMKIVNMRGVTERQRRSRARRKAK